MGRYRGAARRPTQQCSSGQLGRLPRERGIVRVPQVDGGRQAGPRRPVARAPLPGRPCKQPAGVVVRAAGRGPRAGAGQAVLLRRSPPGRGPAPPPPPARGVAWWGGESGGMRESDLLGPGLGMLSCGGRGGKRRRPRAGCSKPNPSHRRGPPRVFARVPMRAPTRVQARWKEQRPREGGPRAAAPSAPPHHGPVALVAAAGLAGRRDESLCVRAFARTCACAHGRRPGAAAGKQCCHGASALSRGVARAGVAHWRLPN